jgi:hypothetical protein
MGLEERTIDPATSERPERSSKVEMVVHERGGPFLFEYVFVPHFLKGSADHLVDKPAGPVAVGEPHGHPKADIEVASGPFDLFAFV